MARKPNSPHSKVVVQLDAESHEILLREAEKQDRTIKEQARYLLKKALGAL